MIKLQKSLKTVWLKKKIKKKNVEKTAILKSNKTNLKLESLRRHSFIKTFKKKLMSRWQNCCFTLGLFKKQNSKILMSRFSIKSNNKLNKLVGWIIK